MGMLSSNNIFQSFDLSPEEIREGTILFTLQKQVLQNRLAMSAAERVLLPFSPENIQRDAELQGEIRTIQWILAESERMELENNMNQQIKTAQQEVRQAQEDSSANIQELFTSVRNPGPRPD